MEESWKERELRFREGELEYRRLVATLPVQLADLGLRGALAGAIAGLILVLVLALISTFSNRVAITGTHLCVITGLLCFTVVAYGAFVFQRSAQIAARLKDMGGIQFSTSEIDNINNQSLIENVLRQHVEQYHKPLEERLQQIKEELKRIGK
jgi:predicted PurR-regulated permease PerM